MGVFAAFLAGYACAVAACVWALWRATARWSRPRRAAAAAAAALAGLALTPVPIHGGFLLLLPELVSEGLREARRARESRALERRDEREETRFPAHLGREPGPGEWRDPASGLVWSPVVWEGDAVDPAALAAARDACRSRPPAGRWAVPRDAELRLLDLSGEGEGEWLGEGFLWPEAISFPTLVRLSPPRGLPRAGQAPRARRVAARCVAVTPPAPLRGYRSSDVPREEWNAWTLRSR